MPILKILITGYTVFIERILSFCALLTIYKKKSQ